MNRFTVVLSPDPERGGYSVSVPALRGAISEGGDLAEALANIREAIGLILFDIHDSERRALRETPEMVGGKIETIMGFREEDGWEPVVEIAVVDLDRLAVA